MVGHSYNEQLTTLNRVLTSEFSASKSEVLVGALHRDSIRTHAMLPELLLYKQMYSLFTITIISCQAEIMPYNNEW